MAKLSGGPLIDSLKSALVGMKEDTTHVNILFHLSTAFYSRNTDSGIYYGNIGLSLAKRLGWKKGMSNILNALGTNNAIARNYPTALKCYQEAYKYATEVNYQKGMISSLQNMGVTYKNMHDNVRALDHYNKAFEMAQKFGDKATAAIAQHNIGGFYQNLGDLPKAIEYYLASLRVKEEMGDDVNALKTRINIGGIYEKLHQQDKARQQFEEALTVADRVGDKVAMSFVLLALGEMSLNEKEAAKAAGHFTRALEVAKETNSKKAIGDAYSGIGRLLRNQKDHAHALAYFQKAISFHVPIAAVEAHSNDLIGMGDTYMDIAKGGIGTTTTEMPIPIELGAANVPASAQACLKLATACFEEAAAINKENGYTGNLPVIYMKLAQAYEKTGQHAKALEAMRSHIAITDTIFSQENAQKMSRSQLSYEFDRRRFADSLQNAAKVREVRLQFQRQRAYTLAGIGGVVLLLAFSVFVVRNNKVVAREKKRSEDLLLNILPEDVATELKNTGHTTARHFDDVTVLFTDFVNFTSSAEKMKPQALIDELHTCFTKFDDIMQKHGIEKIKTVGDAYLAVAGAPRPHPDHAAAVLEAAKEIVTYMEDRFAKLGDRSFQVRVGVHSGSVVAGTVGVRKFAYDVWGDSVNIAARMEQNSIPGRINVSQSTYELAKHRFHFEYRGEIDAKNKGKLGMYFVV